MLRTAPRTWRLDLDDLATAIDAAADCEVACISCADSCLAEDDVKELRLSIFLDGDCADVCAATARVLARQSHDDVPLVQRTLEACVRACSICADECERHAAHHPHCGVCADACRKCEQACRRLLEAEALGELQSLAGG
jgi:hypothetical protein